mgnify:CR=1 FL=1
MKSAAVLVLALLAAAAAAPIPGAAAIGPEDFRRRMLRIANPLTEDQSVMRTALVFSLLKTMLDNVNTGNLDLKLFEIGKVFHPREGSELPDERDRIGGLLTGRRYEDRWHFTSVQSDFYDLKGCLEGVLGGMGIRGADFRGRSSEPFLHPGRSCDVFHGDRLLGFLGEVHPDVLARMDLKNRAMVFELDVDTLSAVATREPEIRCASLGAPGIAWGRCQALPCDLPAPGTVGAHPPATQRNPDHAGTVPQG